MKNFKEANKAIIIGIVATCSILMLIAMINEWQASLKDRESLTEAQLRAQNLQIQVNKALNK